MKKSAPVSRLPPLLVRLLFVQPVCPATPRREKEAPPKRWASSGEENDTFPGEWGKENATETIKFQSNDE